MYYQTYYTVLCIQYTTIIMHACRQNVVCRQVLYLAWATATLPLHLHTPTWHEQTWAIAACRLGDCSISSSHPKTGGTWERY